ncbi:MAG: hypothetical protein WDN29_01260 [Methylovirgula sp.]
MQKPSILSCLRNYLPSCRDALIRIIIIATLINVALIFAQIRSVGGIQNEHQKKSAEKNQDRQEEEPFWVRVVSDPVSFLTFWVAAFNGGLVFVTWRLVTSTNMLWDAGEKQRKSSERIGEAQVRAYVYVKTCTVNFIRFGATVPQVIFAASNSGQSPARNFLWNITLQYPARGIDRQVVFNPNWMEQIGYDIPANNSISESAIVQDMATEQRIPPGTVITVIRAKIEYRFTDVFDRDWFGAAYFAGTMRLTQTSEMPPAAEWQSVLSQMPKPRDWDEIGKNQQD